MVHFVVKVPVLFNFWLMSVMSSGAVSYLVTNRIIKEYRSAQMPAKTDPHITDNKLAYSSF